MTSYALTKALGEVQDPDHLTIRTSIIGPEIRQSGIGLFNWFMKQRGEVSGYRAVLWNGVTTLELAKAIEFFMNKDVGGLIHLGHPNPVSKYELLLLFKDIWGNTMWLWSRRMSLFRIGRCAARDSMQPIHSRIMLKC